MNMTQFQLLSMGELESFWSELDLAIEAHYRWLSDLNRVLLFDLAINVDDIADAAHQCCHFGRWYHGIENRAIRAMPVYIKIGEIHEMLHREAGEILNGVKRGEPLQQSDFDQLLCCSQDLRNTVSQLKSNIKADISTISMLMTKVFEHATEGVLITKPDATILNVNKAFTKLTGYSHEEAVGQKPNILLSGRHDDDYFKKMWHDLTTVGYWDGEIWNRRKCGEVYPQNFNISALSDNGGEITHYIGIFTDNSSNDVNQAKLYHLAYFDPLTELPNRILMYDRLRHAIAVAKRAKSNIAVFFLDLDGFKRVNDRYGHKEGDNLLKQVTYRIKSCLRESDTVSRFAGDEFTVVLPDVGSNENVESIAGKIVEVVGKPYTIAGEQVSITTSIGITLYPNKAECTESLVKQADLAMYAAKRDGKNRFCHYHESMG